MSNHQVLGIKGQIHTFSHFSPPMDHCSRCQIYSCFQRRMQLSQRLLVFFVILHILFPCQNMVPTIPTMQLISNRSEIQVSYSRHLFQCKWGIKATVFISCKDILKAYQKITWRLSRLYLSNQQSIVHIRARMRQIVAFIRCVLSPVITWSKFNTCHVMTTPWGTVERSSWKIFS